MQGQELSQRIHYFKLYDAMSELYKYIVSYRINICVVTYSYMAW